MRRCFLIFDYDNDLSEARRIAHTGLIRATAPAGFADIADWSAAKEKDVEAVKRMIDQGISGSSVTIALIGARTATLGYVTYALERSLRRHNGVLGIHIHKLKAPNATDGDRGRKPALPEAAVRWADGDDYPSHDWDQSRFAAWVYDVATDWKNYARRRPADPVPPGFKF